MDFKSKHLIVSGAGTYPYLCRLKQLDQYIPIYCIDALKCEFTLGIHTIQAEMRVPKPLIQWL